MMDKIPDNASMILYILSSDNLEKRGNMMNSAVATHIESTPGTCGGKPRIAGTRIRVQDIVIWTEMGDSVDDIVADYPHLTLADVYAALSYYHDNREWIDQDICDADDVIEQMKKLYGQTIVIPKGRKDNPVEHDRVSP
jgi:uncharacterized protein (DUF433 family)